MGATLDFYFDYGSPASYLAWTQVPGIAQRSGASVNFCPILLGGVFGAPTFFVGEHMHFGQDRPPYVEELRGAAGGQPPPSGQGGKPS
jgi:2-hydroxychromene-2-carboxylate isomerase